MTRFLASLALLTLAGCSDPATEEAWTAYEQFSRAAHAGHLDEARSLAAPGPAPFWMRAIERENAACAMQNWRFDSVEIKRDSRSRSGDTARFTAEITVVYVDRRRGFDVVLGYFFGGGDWFRPDEKRRYREEVALTRANGGWQVAQWDFRKVGGTDPKRK